MLKNIKIARTKLKLLAFNCVLLPWPSLTYVTLLCSLNVHKASLVREFFANKNAIEQRLLLWSVSRLCHLQELKVFTARVFVYKNTARIDYYKGALRFYLSLCCATAGFWLLSKWKWMHSVWRRHFYHDSYWT